MADTGKQSPLGVNVHGGYLNNQGLNINPVAAAYMGTSKKNEEYSFGSIVEQTCLRLLTWAINDGYNRGEPGPPATSVPTLTNATYNNLISIGNGTIPGLGNSKPPSYTPVDPAGVWTDTAVNYGKQHATEGGYDPNDVLPGPATSGFGNSDSATGDNLSGYGIEDQQQNATWYPYDTTNPNKSVTQWGWIRCHALQAWNEFNWNANIVERTHPEYKEFCSSFMTGASWLAYTNQAIMAAHNADTFLDGIFSNMNDLVSGDITGISLSSKNFGDDLIDIGDAVNLAKVDSIGLPSVLLATLATNSAITRDLSFALLAAGLESREIDAIASGQAPFVTAEQEQKIYGAFLIVNGQSLIEILAILQCQTPNLETLADLLNVKKMFPRSHNTLTVPKYNAELGLPTNSKTYYPIYTTGSVNGALNTPEMEDYVDIQQPAGKPPVFKGRRLPDIYEIPKRGFASYLYNQIPEDQAIAAGALSFTMRQVRNIERVDVKKFAKAAKAMETMENLPLTAGTSKPTNQEMLDNVVDKLALGSGPYGTYTYSDLFGCMSGLPYPWKLIKKRIGQLQTEKLANIYRELFLAVTWEAADASVETNPYYVNVQQYRAPGTLDPSDPGQPRIDNLYYTLTISGGGTGGGYGRGTAPAPTVTITPNTGGASLTAVVTDEEIDPGSVGNGTFGRLTFESPNPGSAVLYNTVTNSANNDPPSLTGANAPPAVTIAVQAPPIDTLPVQPDGAVDTGGTNSPSGTDGWGGSMNDVVQDYIDQANAEIEQILQNKPSQATHLNTYWKNMGTQLVIEQRARYKALPPVSVPKDFFANPYPIMIETFVDSIPQFSQDTKPHMSAQTIEAITDYTTIGGQSAVGMMRQERNQVRLGKCGIELDNNIPSDLSSKEAIALTTNGTLPAALDDSGIPSPLLENTPYTYTLPAWPAVSIAGEEITPVTAGSYYFTPSELTGQFIPVLEFIDGGDITPILEGNPNPVVGPVVPAGPTSLVLSPQVAIPIIKPPIELDPTNVPNNLNPDYTSSTLLPSAPTVQQAIDQVIACNCDCWID